jgi:hypothetical protein
MYVRFFYEFLIYRNVSFFFFFYTYYSLYYRNLHIYGHVHLILILHSYSFPFLIPSLNLVALCSPSNPIFSLSVSILSIIILQMSKLMNRLAFLPSDTVIFCSPFILPIYSYSLRTQYINDETDMFKVLLGVFFLAILWGSLMAIFLFPVYVGKISKCVCMNICLRIHVSIYIYICMIYIYTYVHIRMCIYL